MAIQRLRVKYGRTGDLRFIAHLDVMRLWHRAMRRSGIAMAYSEGSTPRPRLSIAAALPVGVTSEGELLDVYLKRRISAFYFLTRIQGAIPETLLVYEAVDVSMDAPSLQSQVRLAEYRVGVAPDGEAESVEDSVNGLLGKETIPWEHRRDKEVRRYDLRALVRDLWVEERSNGTVTLGMLLRADPNASGRPEQIVAALGLPEPVWVHRTRLLLAPDLERGGIR